MSNINREELLAELYKHNLMNTEISEIVNGMEEAGRHPQKRECWTQQDVTDADDLQFIMPDLVKVERADTERVGDIRLWTKDGTFSWISGAMFPSLKVGEKVGLDEILGGAEMNAPETVKSYIVRTQMERILHG